MENWEQLDEKSDWLKRKMLGDEFGESADQRLNELADKLKVPGYLEEKINQQEHYDYQKAYTRLFKKYQRRSLIKLLRIAAVIVLALGSGMVVWLVKEKQDIVSVSFEVGQSLYKREIRYPFLQMPNGEKMKLKPDSLKIWESNGVKVCIDSIGLHYEKLGEERENELVYNTLVVPRGSEYFLTLADGTQVWLNADTELKYPVKFGKEVREVTLKGEAYFKVTKAAEWPFVVKAELGEVRVLGTEFNVNSYGEGTKLVTTLVRGKVACRLAGDKQIILEPNQQLVTTKEGKTQVLKVDPRFSVCWKDGLFLFKNERLEDIMEQLSRWYDIKVFYANDRVKNLHFSGDLSRFKSIDVFIQMFEKSSEVKFKLTGNVLIIGL